MPLFEVKAPDGGLYEVRTPEGGTEKDAIRYLQNQFAAQQPQEEPIPEYKPTPETGFIPSIKRGTLGLQSLVADVAPAMVGRVGEKLGIQGAGEYANRQMQEAVQAQERIQQMYPAAVPSYTDIKSGGDLLNYVIESVGELIPSMIPSILTGGAAGIAGRGAMVAAEQAAKKASMDAAQKTLISYSGSKLTQDQLVNLAKQDAIKAGRDAASKVALKYQASGAVAGSAIQNVPEVYQNVAQETGQEDLGAALLFGGFNSVLDAITPLTLLRKAGGAGITKNELIGAWYKRAGKGVLTGFATEGATEAVQEMSSASAEKFVDNNKDFFTPQNFERFINAGLKGGIGGGAISGATNVAFGQKEAIKPITPTETAPTEQAAVIAEPTKAKTSTEEALAKVDAVVKKKEEVPSDNQPDDTTSGASVEVPGGPQPSVSAAPVAGVDISSVADVGNVPSTIADGTGEQLNPLEQAPVQQDQDKLQQFANWAISKGINPADGTQDWNSLYTQWETESAQTSAPVETKEVLPEIAKEIETVTPVVEEEPKKSIPAPVYNASETTKSLIAAEKARKVANKKPVEVLNQAVETGLDIEPQARRTATHQAGISLAQTYRQQQTELAKEIDTDETLSKEEKAAGKAFQNYMIVGNNNIKNALNILAADMFDGAGYNSNPYLPNVGGASAKLFYGSLNGANKKFVDDKISFFKAQEKRLSKFSGSKKDKAKLEEDKFDQSIIGETAEAKGEMFGGTTPAFMANVLRGDLRSALNDVVKDTSGEFTALEKEVSKKLLQAKTLPSLVVVDKLPNNALGAYVNNEDTVYIPEYALNSHPVLHETVHGHTLTLIRSALNNEVSNPGVRDLNELYEFLKTNNPELATEYAFETKDLAEFASEVMSNRNLQDKLKAIPYKRLNAFTEFARAVMRILGIGQNDKSNALAAALISVDRTLSTGREFQETAEFAPGTGETAALNTDVKVEKETLKPELRGLESAEDWINSIPGQPEPRVKKVKDAFTSVTGAKELVRLFQNERYPIKNWEDLLATAEKIDYSGNDSTAVYTQISLSTGRAEDEFLVKMYNPSNAMYKAIGEYSKARGINEDVALKELQAVFIALHEGERRHVKYLMTVPLTAEAAQQRDVIMDLVRSADINEDTATALRTKLEELVVNNKQVKGYGQNSEPNSPFPLDENTDYYNVAGIRPAIREETLSKYYAPNKEIIDQIKATVQEVHKATIELNKKANYWSQPVSNIVAFYGFENYVPLKGRPDKKEAVVDDMLNFDSKYNGRELQEKESAFDGRVSESNNPLLQTLSDGVRAALRAGRGGTYTSPDGTTEQYGITLTVKNAIDKKLIPGKKIATVQFKDRYKVGEDDTLPTGENTFFHYNPDGSIDIYSVENEKLREAIRRTYRTSQPLIDAANNITSLMGQLHTRYNVAFAPMNFVRDTLTNAFTMGAQMGPSMVGAVASKVTQGGLARALKVANLYRKGEFDAIEKLGEKDPYIKAMYEYIQLGGKVAYVSGIGAESQLQQMQKNLGRNKIAATKDSIDSVIDIWTNSFEFASRTAAYQVVKAKYMNGPEKLPEREAAVKAAGYVKNLANFEQVGAWGKGLGAIFMFFRPSATGAVRAMEALVPLFRNIDTALAGLPEGARFLVDEQGNFVKNEKGERVVNEKAIADFRNNMMKQRASAQAMLMSLAGSGAVIYLMALMLAEEDDEGRNKVATDDLARWTRYARFHIPGTDTIFQIPWGFGLGAFASAGAQIMSFGLGNNSIKNVFNNVKDVGFDAFLPLPISRINMWDNPAAWAMDSATPSLFRPFFEYAMNMDGLGREIYNNRQTRSGDAYTGGDNIPELYKEAAKLLANTTNGAVDWSPNTMYFFANNYADGLTRLIHNSYNIGMVGTGQKEFNPKTDTLAFDSFFGAKSNFDAREFSKVENQIKDKERKLNMFKNDPERYMNYISENPFDQGVVDIYNKGVNGDLKEARALANKYRAMPGLTPKERKELLDNIKEQQNLIKRHLISVFRAYEDF
jgi:hypothetical protein